MPLLREFFMGGKRLKALEGNLKGRLSHCSETYHFGKHYSFPVPKTKRDRLIFIEEIFSTPGVEYAPTSGAIRNLLTLLPRPTDDVRDDFEDVERPSFVYAPYIVIGVLLPFLAHFIIKKLIVRHDVRYILGWANTGRFAKSWLMHRTLSMLILIPSWFTLSVLLLAAVLFGLAGSLYLIEHALPLGLAAGFLLIYLEFKYGLELPYSAFVHRNRTYGADLSLAASQALEDWKRESSGIRSPEKAIRTSGHPTVDPDEGKPKVPVILPDSDSSGFWDYAEDTRTDRQFGPIIRVLGISLVFAVLMVALIILTGG